MQVFLINKKLKGFTISELMIVLALTGMLSGFTYMGYNQVQRLLKQFSDQSFFIGQMHELKLRLNHISSQPGELRQSADNVFKVISDSLNVSLELGKDNILFNNLTKTDTLKLIPENVKTVFEPVNETASLIHLVKLLEFDVFYGEQLFHFSLRKSYDAYSKLKLETQLLN